MLTYLEDDIATLVKRALAEDIGTGDVTTDAIVPRDLRARGAIYQKAPGVVFGYRAASAAFRELDPGSTWTELEPESVWREPKVKVAQVEGHARVLLTAERVALNFLQHLSGVATLTACFVKEVEGTGVTVIDTRKTIPGLRRLEKAAVVAGGGRNHRMGLYDAVLIKDNHIEIAGGVEAAIKLAQANAPRGIEIKTECRSLEEVERALAAGAKWLLLDNMGPEEIKAAAEVANERAELEVSGGVTFEMAREIASLPVQYIAVGALTHSAPALDLNMEIENI